MKELCFRSCTETIISAVNVNVFCLTWDIVRTTYPADCDNIKSSYPGSPPLSIWLARVTSSLHTSNCHLRRPSTPHSTFPVWIPILMSTLKPVASRTNLRVQGDTVWKCIFMPHTRTFLSIFSRPVFPYCTFLVRFHDYPTLSRHYLFNASCFCNR